MSKETVAVQGSSDGTTILALEFDPASDGWFLYAHASPDDMPITEMWHMTREDAINQASADYNVSHSDWDSAEEGDEAPTYDSNGAVLQNGDSVTLTKDLDVKGSGVTLKRGTTVKNITLTNDPDLIDCRTKEVKGLVLKTCFVKKI